MTGTGAERKEERDFLDWLQRWKQGLPALSLADVLQENGGPEQAAVLCVDMVNGFAHEGPLASPRVRAIIPAVTALFQRAYQHGIRRFILPQDNHPPDSPEFGCWPAHCVAGTAESETIPELTGLAFSSLYRVVPKRSISSGIGTDLEDALGPEPLQVAICAGDCTDLCLYQLAMHLRLRANAKGESLRVIVPEDCVQTYDLPIAVATGIGAMPHPGDLLHDLFLYHMALNGVEVCRQLD